MCADTMNASASSGDHVPDFETVGFVGGSSGDALAEAHAALPDLLALSLSVCVSASYNPTTNEICFTIPVYGNRCVTSPVHIPIGGQLKACAQTCGTIIPKGLKVTIYLNDKVLFTKTIIGSC